jgi:hypothetical protein
LEFLINKYGEEGEGSPEKGGVILESDWILEGGEEKEGNRYEIGVGELR